MGRRARVTDPAGLTTSTSYDVLGRPVLITQSTGAVEQRRWQQAFDPDDNLVSATSPEGRTESFGYDGVNRAVRQDEVVNAGRTIHTSFGYDASGNRTRLVDGDNHATDYTFTPWNQPQSTVEPGGATWTTSYDPAGRATRSSAPGGVAITSDFDAQD